MNNKFLKFIKNFSYTLSSNLISTIISTLIVLVIPKLIGVEEYGYWQLYIFYSSYVGFLQFGWNDGIYLRYGGYEYKDLNKKTFFSQFWMLFISQIIISVTIIIFSLIYIKDIDKIFIFISVAICVVLMGVRAMPIFILQATNRIKEYAKITILDRIVYCVLIILLITVGIRQYKLMIIADLVGKAISLLYSMYCCYDIVFRNVHEFKISIDETKKNISVGIKLMLSNIASMLIIGIVRFGIERSWDVETFGKISLTFSISSMMMIFINAIGIIMFPILKRMSIGKVKNIYKSIRDLLMIVLFAILILYYPFSELLSKWLPRYIESLRYMAILFPMCIYEGKMSLLINTYLKTLRKEKIMLKINIITLVVSFIITIATTLIFKNLNFAVISIVGLLAFRCILAESILTKMIRVKMHKDILLELFMTITFILTGWFINNLSGIIIYFVCYLLYIFMKKNDIRATIKNIRMLSIL